MWKTDEYFLLRPSPHAPLHFNSRVSAVDLKKDGIVVREKTPSIAKVNINVKNERNYVNSGPQNEKYKD